MLKIKNWEKFQHYKDRNPPWIKLQTDTFQNYEFSRLQDASKLLAVCIWTLASRSKDGSIPDDLEYIKQQCFLGSSVSIKNLKELILTGFIVDASNVLADCKQSASPETETEGYRKEGETEEKEGAKFSNFPDWLPRDAWNGFVIMRKKIRKPLTDRAIEITIKELKKLKSAGHDPEKVLDQSTQRNWAGVFEIKENYHGKPAAPSKHARAQAALKRSGQELGYIATD